MPENARKQRQWVTSDIDSNALAATATQLVRNMSSDFETVLGRTSASVTVAAIKGRIHTTNGATVASNNSKLAYGIAWLPENLTTVAEIPNPLTDDYDWIWREVVFKAEGVSGDQVTGQGTDSILVDSQSMRRQRQTNNKLCLIARWDGNQSVNRVANLRTLYLLP